MSGIIKTYSHKEEQLNIWSHFSGIVLSIIGLALLLHKGIKSGSALIIVSYAIYGVSMLVLYLASTLYHSAKEPQRRQKLNIFDHSAIYVLIAGTYTPFSLLVLKGAWGWTIFGVVWGIAALGISLKLFFTGRFNLASTISYVLMGWVVVIAIKPLISNFNIAGLLLLAAGGLFYTIGAVLYSIKHIPNNHAIFHFFVLLGSLTHFLAIYFCIN